MEFAVYVWTIAVSATKKLRIRKYPYTCGRGLSLKVLFYEINLINDDDEMMMIMMTDFLETRLSNDCLKR